MAKSLSTYYFKNRQKLVYLQYSILQVNLSQQFFYDAKDSR